jgi:hypothetical protein
VAIAPLSDGDEAGDGSGRPAERRRRRRMSAGPGAAPREARRLDVEKANSAVCAEHAASYVGVAESAERVSTKLDELIVRKLRFGGLSRAAALGLCRLV